ncbi:hypothetical protein K438DRAFT_1755397 [Mycena galopus ATCC 62051]|nr:hypothetical protein K438DRAFT_1755397 [Mycena galopus ATCC 62051]
MINISVAPSIECLTSTNEKNRFANGAGGHDLKDGRRGKYKGDTSTWGADIPRPGCYSLVPPILDCKVLIQTANSRRQELNDNYLPYLPRGAKVHTILELVPSGGDSAEYWLEAGDAENGASASSTGSPWSSAGRASRTAKARPRNGLHSLLYIACTARHHSRRDTTARAVARLAPITTAHVVDSDAADICEKNPKEEYMQTFTVAPLQRQGAHADRLLLLRNYESVRTYEAGSRRTVSEKAPIEWG